MKYGLVYYKYTDNLGDDILSYSAGRFLPQIDYYIDRESLDTFIPDERESVAVILNGWFLHRSYAFPPSPYIYPLFTGIHFSTDHIAYGDYSWLDGFVTDYLQEHAPIGCRDSNTLAAMQKRQINSFFSGCLTMTLEPFSEIEKTNKIILTDVPTDVQNYIGKLCPDTEIICKTHTIQDSEKNLEWTKRKYRLEDYLKLYQSAKLIITSRLHCALPSIALGTPVILIGDFNSDFYDRIADYTKYCKCFNIQEILSGKADNLIRNSFVNEDISSIRNQLIHSCTQFIKEAGKIDFIVPPIEEYLNLYVNRTNFLRRSIEQLFNNHVKLHNTYQQEHENYKQLSELSQKLMAEYQRLLG